MACRRRTLSLPPMSLWTSWSRTFWRLLSPLIPCLLWTLTPHLRIRGELRILILTVDHVLKWVRYINDILMVWDDSSFQLENFRALLNQYHSNLQFTLEIGNKSIHFLDLTITLVPHQDKIIPRFNIFRNSAHAGVTINGSSLHPCSYIQAACLTMILRLFSISLSRECLPGGCNSAKIL